MPASDVAEWVAFFALKKQEAEAAALAARADGKAQHGREARVQKHRRR